MTSHLFWTLMFIQLVMGAFDTIYHHELTERLPWRASQQHELALHAARNLLYAAVFILIGWFEPHGAWAFVLMAILVAEVVITLADFIEEDLSRALAGERAGQPHAARPELRRHSLHPHSAIARMVARRDGAEARVLRLLECPDGGIGRRCRDLGHAGLFRRTSRRPARGRARRCAGRSFAGTPQRADHRRHRLYRQPPGGRARRRRP